MSLSYAQRDEIVKLTLEEPGAFTACDLCALDAGADEDGYRVKLLLQYGICLPPA